MFSELKVRIILLLAGLQRPRRLVNMRLEVVEVAGVPLHLTYCEAVQIDR